MKKLALDLEALKVESFEAVEEAPSRGTVRAMSDTNHVRLCTFTDCTCPDTCDGTGCQYSLASWCQICTGGQVC